MLFHKVVMIMTQIHSSLPKIKCHARDVSCDQQEELTTDTVQGGRVLQHMDISAVQINSPN